MSTLFILGACFSSTSGCFCHTTSHRFFCCLFFACANLPSLQFFGHLDFCVQRSAHVVYLSRRNWFFFFILTCKVLCSASTPLCYIFVYFTTLITTFGRGSLRRGRNFFLDTASCFIHSNIHFRVLKKIHNQCG
jgi:hypothetical protein